MRRTFVAVDFDGTIVEHAFPDIGNPVPHAFDWLKKFKEYNATLILWTMRSDGQRHGNVLADAVEFCRRNGVEFDWVNEHPQNWTTSNKAYAHTYIDDAACGCPLIPGIKNQYRQMVDWTRVGPQVFSLITERMK